ncbi:MAG: Zn-ribbon domain-containing OB-fold protein [Candidatus Hodarchaeota archaeon]
MSTKKVPTGYKCLKCGKLHYPKHARCLSCKHRDFELVELPSEGRLITWTMLKAPPTGIDQSSLYLGIIDLGEVQYTGQLEIDPETIKIGVKVKPMWKKVREIGGKSIYGFVWVLI